MSGCQPDELRQAVRDIDRLIERRGRITRSLDGDDLHGEFERNTRSMEMVVEAAKMYGEAVENISQRMAENFDLVARAQARYRVT